METFERARLDAFFGRIAARFAPAEQVTSFLVTQLLPERPGFVRAVAAMSGLRAVLPKPKSVDGTTRRVIATGAVSLRGEDFPHVRNGAYVATVTSSEDELELNGLPDVYTRTTAGEHVTRYQTTGHYFYLANGGNAVNFLHGASVGPFIHLVQAEILAAIKMLALGDLASGMHEVSAADRASVAGIWLDYFSW